MKKTIVSFITILFLCSCMSFAVTSNSLTEQATRSHRSVEQVRKDVDLERSIKNLISAELKIFSEINNIKKVGSYDIIVIEGRVFLIGVVAQPEIKNFIYNKIWEHSKVEEVINELQVSLELSKNKMKDFWMKRVLSFKLLTTKDIRSSNYELFVVNSIVYVVGIADNDVEIKKVGYLASTVEGIESAIIHIMNKNDARRF